MIGLVFIAAIIITVAVIGTSFGLFHFTGTDATKATLNNYNNAKLEHVLFTEYTPFFDNRGNWDGYYLSSDGRMFYTNSKVTYQNFDLFREYDVYTYKIELNGFPGNAWGIKAVVSTGQNLIGEENST